MLRHATTVVCCLHAYMVAIIGAAQVTSMTADRHHRDDAATCDNKDRDRSC